MQKITDDAICIKISWNRFVKRVQYDPFYSLPKLIIAKTKCSRYALHICQSFVSCLMNHSSSHRQLAVTFPTLLLFALFILFTLTS